MAGRARRDILHPCAASHPTEGDFMRLHAIKRLLKTAEKLTFRQIKKLVMRLYSWGLLDSDEVEYFFTKFPLSDK